MNFKKYQHVEKLRTSHTNGILDGTIYIFPKLDGTNGSVWLESGELKAGSRNRELTLENDNAGFYKAMLDNSKVKSLLEKHPNYRLFGEWLVPHSLKTYKEDAWRKFYIFDVVEDLEGDYRYLPYSEYQELLKTYGLEYVPCYGVGENLKEEQLYNFLDKNNFLIEDGKGTGEGIVIKNYNFVNNYGKVVWAKIVTSDFKEKHVRSMGAMKIQPSLDIEEKIVEQFCTKALIEKEYNKIINEIGEWESKLIPRLLHTIFYSLVTEESWNFVKKFKNPTINFKLLERAVNIKIKKELPEMF